MAGSVGSGVINIGGADPIQGYDVGVWVHDAQTNKQVLLGQFTSIVVTIRNATEAYMEFGQRYPRYLDGEMQIAYVMEKGLLDLNAFQHTFGFKRITRDKRFGRSPRFTVTFSADPVDAAALEGAINTDPLQDWASGRRDVTGRFVLEQCKVDSWHFAATAGRQVVATQWQGVAEGFSAVPGDYTTSTDLQTPVATSSADIRGIKFDGASFPGSNPNAISTTDQTIGGYDVKKS